MKTISASDLKLAPELSNFGPLDWIDPKNDLAIYPYLHMLGIDTDYAVSISASQHRNLQGKLVIGYQFSGEIRLDPEFRASPFCTVEDRIIINGATDLGLADDMSRSLSMGREYGSGVVEGFPAELCNPDEQEIIERIAVLEQLIDVARPGRFKECGSLKTVAEYHAPPVAPVKKERRKRKLPNLQNDAP